MFHASFTAREISETHQSHIVFFVHSLEIVVVLSACSGGVGRSGTFCFVDVILNKVSIEACSQCIGLSFIKNLDVN